ncbi:LysM peptidoglycan-binding domain-containing protein [Thermodesulfobacteriota bacterium]
MIKLRFIFVPVFFLSFFFGCTQSLKNTKTSQNKYSERPESALSTASKTARDDAATAQQPRLADLPKSKNSADKKIRENGPLTMQEAQPILDEALDFCQVSQDFWQKGELENALEALDKAYSLILTIDTGDNPKLIQQKEDLRFMISKRILEIYASRNIVVNGDYNAIPMVMNKHIQAEIDLFTKGKEKKFFIESYQRSGKYRPMIVPELTEAGLPVELSWLPLIESGFKVNALSRARALGLWQFIPSTGYKFGLKRNNYIDERIDPEKSTKAAISYLKDLHQIFGDWTTVLAGYNCGEGKVLRVIRSQNINYLDNFWDLYERLPRETARYVPRYMATLHIVKNPEKYGLDKIKVDPPLEYETVIVSKQVRLKDVAKKIGINEKRLVELNPELRYKILPKEKYPLKVPLDKTQVLLAKIDEIPVTSLPRSAYVYHRVRQGESLSTIAEKYRTRVSSIARANNIRRHDYIVAGKKLKIPLKGGRKYSPKTYAAPRYGKASTHIVRKGDSLWILARRYGTTTKKIQEKNNLRTTNLYIGQVLKIPGDGDVSPPREDLKTYLVKQGDSPFQIAQKHKMPLERFLRINHLTPRSKIYPGQKLYVE